MSDEFSFLIDDSMLLDASDVAIGRVRPSETIRTWNDSELKSIVSGGGGGGIGEGNGSESAAIVAICEGRGALSEIGFSIFDTQSNVCHIIQVRIINSDISAILCSLVLRYFELF